MVATTLIQPQLGNYTYSASTQVAPIGKSLLMGHECNMVILSKKQVDAMQLNDKRYICLEVSV